MRLPWRSDVAPRAAVYAFRAPRAAQAEDAPLLAPREVQALQLIANGHDNRTAGIELHVSAETIKKYIARARFALRVHTTPAAVAEAMRRGLIK